MQKEVEDMEKEIGRLRAELSHFDGYFFNEVDDLKHNYSEAVKLNVIYESQLKNISARHKIPVNIRADDVDGSRVQRDNIGNANNQDDDKIVECTRPATDSSK